MQRLCFILSTLVLASLLAGCAPSANVQPEETQSLEDYRMPTDVPEASALTKAAQTEVALLTPPADCPITVPPKPEFVPPSGPHLPSMPFPNEFWFGFEHLWTSLPTSGVWLGLPLNPDGYTQKIMWWSDLFSLNDEPEPKLVVTGERLDANAPPLNVSRATNAFAGDIGEAMLVGVDFPTLGCWKITGRYKKTGLDFVVWVAP